MRKKKDLDTIKDPPIVKVLKVKQVNYNWFFDSQNGESFSTVIVGKAQYPSCPIVTFIKEVGGCNPHCDIFYENGSCKAVYNLNEVVYEPDID